VAGVATIGNDLGDLVVVIEYLISIPVFMLLFPSVRAL
jgi:hypothetical protein